MGYGFKHGGGGGSASSALNFRVVGGTEQPTAPKENDIWVHTDTEITGWVLSPAEPEEPAEGLVWIVTGTSSAAAFNALKKNALVVCPLSCRQYISGEWTEMTANSRQDGAWVDWWAPGTLFDNGRYDEAVTGGWTSYAYKADSGYTGISSAVTINDDRLIAKMTANGSNRSSFVSTVNTIDMREYVTAHLEFLNASGSGWARVSLYNESGESLAFSDMFWNAGGTVTKSIDLDISGISAENRKACRVGLMLWANSSSAVITVEMSLARLM